MLINLSNHRSDGWEIKQLQSAIEVYGQVVDFDFPVIDSMADLKRVYILALEYVEKCRKLASVGDALPFAIHIAGEMCFVYNFVTLAKTLNLDCICSTTKRRVTEEKNIKTSTFEFIRFRNYF